MNFTPEVGWYYLNANDRTASWTGVEYFYRFLTENTVNPIGNGEGPFAEEVSLQELRIGDFVQLGGEDGFYHTLISVGFQSNGVPLMAAHSRDTYARPLTSWIFQRLRCIHVLAARKIDF